MAAVELVPETSPAEGGEEVEEQIAPSVISIVNRHVIGGAEVSLAAQDGSRVVRLHSMTGGALIEISLAVQLCEFLSMKLVEVEVIEQGDEDVTESD